MTQLDMADHHRHLPPEISVQITDGVAELVANLQSDDERVATTLRWLIDLGFTEMVDQTFDPILGLERMVFAKGTK